MEIRFKVHFRNRRNGVAGVADLAFDDLLPFASRYTIDKLVSYPVGSDPYPRNTPDPDMDYDKSRHRCS